MSANTTFIGAILTASTEAVSVDTIFKWHRQKWFLLTPLENDIERSPSLEGKKFFQRIFKWTSADIVWSMSAKVTFADTGWKRRREKSQFGGKKFAKKILNKLLSTSFGVRRQKSPLSTLSKAHQQNFYFSRCRCKWHCEGRPLPTPLDDVDRDADVHFVRR